MPTATYTPIASTTLSSAQTSVSFDLTSIQNYRDLILVCSARSTGTSGVIRFSFNSSTTNYSQVSMYGDGGAAASYTTSDQGIISDNIAFSSDASGTFASVIFQVFDYTQSKHKSCLLRNSITPRLAYATAGRWADTSAVTTLTATMSSNQFASGSTFSLYGVIA